MEDSFLSYIFPSDDLTILTFMIGTFFVSGIIKGFLGIGLPAAAMALLTLVVSPTYAISLLVLPILFTNLSQYTRSKHRAESFQNYWVLGAAILVSIFITSLFIAWYPTALLTISIGVAMIIVALNGLIGFKLNIGSGISWQLGFGIISGLLGGVSSIWSPPVAMYLIARGIDKERFISATGFLFLVGALPLGLGLFFGGILTLEILLQSGLGLVIVLLGFRVGELLRARVTQAWFEKSVLIAFFFMGVRLIAVGIF